MAVQTGPRRWRPWRGWGGRLLSVGALAGLLVGLVMAVNVYQFGQQDGAARADVIVVLGAGLHPDGQPTEAMRRRAEHGAALYAAGYAPAVVCSGGYTLEIPVSEASVCADLLAAEGVPREAIWLEEQSRSTEENAIYTAQLMQAQGWRTALVTSDSYHLWRARLLFELHGVALAGTSPAQATTGPLNPLEYLASLGREVLALFWQGAKDLLGLPFTHV